MPQPSDMLAPTATDPTDPFAAYTLGQPLIASSDDHAGFRIHNDRDPDTGLPEAHRIYLTGYDRAAHATAVRGRLLHVTHGTLSPSSPTSPATLVVFEWLLVPGRLGRRFKEVNIDVTFSAEGPRRGGRTPQAIARFAPAVEKVAPSVPLKVGVTGREVTEEVSVAGKVVVGYAPVVEAGPEASRKRTVVTRRLNFRFAAGYPAFVRKSGGEPNSVHWTLRENASQQSGLPSLVRTAVLVKRRAGDDLGPFKAEISANVKASVVSDGVESLLKLVGLVPKDDPVFFDPRVSAGLENGAAVLDGSQDVKSETSPVKNKSNLAGENLDDFLMFEEDIREPAGDQNEAESGSEATYTGGQSMTVDDRVQVGRGLGVKKRKPHHP